MKITTRRHRGHDCHYWRHDGQPRYRKIKDERKIEEERADLLAELRHPIVKHSRKPLAKRLDEFIRSIAKRKDARLVRQRIEAIIAAGNFRNFADFNPTAVSEAVESLYRAARDPNKRREAYGKLSQQSQAHYMSAVKQFCRWAAYVKKCDTEHRLVLLRIPKPKILPNKRDRFQPDELLAIIAAAAKSDQIVEGYDGQTRSRLYALASVTGLRRSELAAVRPSSFDVAARVVSVPGAYCKNGEDAHQPLPKKALSWLLPWLEEAKDDSPLFYALAEKRTRDMVMNDLAAAGLPYITPHGRRTFHCFRNTYISGLLDQGKSVKDVMELGRLSDPKLLNRYGRPRTGAAAEAVDNLPCPTLLGGGEASTERSPAKRQRLDYAEEE